MKAKILLLLSLLIPSLVFAADNIQVTQGAGTTVATDQVTRNTILEHQQICKPSLGPDGTHEGFMRMGQQTMANSQAVVLSSDQTGVPVKAAAVGGYTPGKLISAATTNATVIKASAGTLGFLAMTNKNAADRCLHIYNKATAPTVGTDVATIAFLIPGNTTGAGSNVPIPPQGLNFSTGVSISITTDCSDTNNTAVAAGEIVINYGYN